MGIAALNSEQALMYTSLLQNRMALDISTAAWRGTCAIIHTEYCVCIPDYSQKLSDSLQDLKSQVQAMADSTPPFGTALWNWISTSIWWKVGPDPDQKPFCALIAFWPLYSKLSPLLCNVSHAVLCLVRHDWTTLCNPMDCSLPGSSVHGGSPGSNTGVSSHAFLQGFFPTQGSNPRLLHCRRFLYHMSHQRNPVSHIEVIRLQMVTEMEPRMICKGPLGHLTGRDLTAIPCQHPCTAQVSQISHPLFPHNGN